MNHQGDNGMLCLIVLDFQQSQQSMELERHQWSLDVTEMDVQLFLIRVFRLKEGILACPGRHNMCSSAFARERRRMRHPSAVRFARVTAETSGAVFTPVNQ
jgi:hypothetical protein